MSAIIIQAHPEPRIGDDGILPTDWMPLSTRHLVAKELNRLWEEFVTDMHDGPTGGPEVARKFWKFVLAGG